MPSVRCKNGRYYYRVSKKIGDKWMSIERGSFATYDEAFIAGCKAFPSQRRKKLIHINNHIEEIIFAKYPEETEAFLPLFLIRRCHVTPKEVYNLCEEDLDLTIGTWNDIFLDDETIRILRRHLDKINSIHLSLQHINYDKNYLIVHFKNGKKISPNQIKYITKCIRKEINPEWNWKDWSR